MGYLYKNKLGTTALYQQKVDIFQQLLCSIHKNSIQPICTTLQNKNKSHIKSQLSFVEASNDSTSKRFLSLLSTKNKIGFRTCFMTAKHAKTGRSTQKHGEARRSMQKLAEARKNTQKHAEARGSTRKHAEARGSTRKHAEAHKSV